MSEKKKESGTRPARGLRGLVDRLRKRFGDEALTLLDGSANATVPCFGTGSLGLDEALGNGLPRGRVIEVFGPAITSRSQSPGTLSVTSSNESLTS